MEKFSKELKIKVGLPEGSALRTMWVGWSDNAYCTKIIRNTWKEIS